MTEWLGLIPAKLLQRSIYLIRWQSRQNFCYTCIKTLVSKWVKFFWRTIIIFLPFKSPMAASEFIAKLSRFSAIFSKPLKCLDMCFGQAEQMLWRAFEAALPNPLWLRHFSKKSRTGSKDVGCTLIHSQSSPSNRILVCLTAMWVFSGEFKMASTTLGTTSFSSLQKIWVNLEVW